jgi:mannose-6-phosphate isomerase-like protein (cupin superfamily)
LREPTGAATFARRADPAPRHTPRPAPPGETFESPRTGARLTIEEISPAALVVERLYRPGMGGARVHVHLDFAETYVVRRGVADARLDDLRLRLTADRPTLRIPPGVPHVNPRNTDTADS